MKAALSVCSEPDCPNLSTGGLCDECRAARRQCSDHRRGSAQERGYDREHERRFRAAVLERDPMCVECMARPSTVADHYPLSRRELVEQGLDPNDPNHGRGLCKPCHDRHTARAQPGGFQLNN